MFIHQLSFLIALATSAVAAAATEACYCKNSDTIASSCYGGIGAVPCGNATNGGFVQCCGKGDICGADGFCHYTHAQVLGSGYYIGGCTDPSYKDPICPTGCTSEKAPDVVYNSVTELWACCSGPEGGTNCSDPTLDTFQAPSPQILFATTSTSTSTTSTSTTSSTSTSSPTSQSTTSAASSPTATSAPSSASLSSGAAAGIGVGVAVALIAIAAIVALVCLRRRRKGRAVSTQLPQDEHVYSPDAYSKDTRYDNSGMVKDQKYDVLGDKHGRMFASELPGREPSELPGSKHSNNLIELADRRE